MEPGQTVLDLPVTERLVAADQFVSDLLVHTARNVDVARLGELLEPCRDVDTLAVDIVRLDDHVTEIDADAETNPVIVGHVKISANHALLDYDRAAYRFDRTVEHGKKAVAAGPDQPPAMLGDRGVDQLAQQSLHPQVGPSLVNSHETRITRDVTHHDRGEFSRAFLRHEPPRLPAEIIPKSSSVRQRFGRTVSVAHDMSGLGSTRSVR